GAIRPVLFFLLLRRRPAAHALFQAIEVHRLGDDGPHRLGDVLLRLQPLDLFRREPDADALGRPLHHVHFCRGRGCSMPVRLPSVSWNETYWPMPGISIGSPRTLPPESVTLFIDSWMSSSAMTTDGYCAGQ